MITPHGHDTMNKTVAITPPHYEREDRPRLMMNDKSDLPRCLEPVWYDVIGIQELRDDTASKIRRFVGHMEYERHVSSYPYKLACRE